MPIWWPAYVCGWVEIAHLIPHFLKKAYKNQITWKWHVQIPYSYWEKKYPSKDYSAKEREAAIQKYMDSVEQNLCGPDNAEKPIFSHYAVNEMNGRIEEEWKIKPLENKYQGSDNPSGVGSRQLGNSVCIDGESECARCRYARWHLCRQPGRFQYP